MRLLLDQNLSWRLIELLAADGIEASHVRNLGMHSATDSEILSYAAANGFTIVSQDSDFSVLLAQSRASTPSVILLRIPHVVTAAEIADVLLTNLGALVEDIEAGAIVSMGPERVRVRRLPFR
ncbi:MAG: DUF5615 family PIN-like protein [Ancrocorticia sp.]|uniref:DUF5615 family PIN-like protein n=1 Tax=Ancrocorticia sp. TaxID=2593684 RepID=UPI003F918880